MYHIGREVVSRQNREIKDYGYQYCSRIWHRWHFPGHCRCNKQKD
ncbi:hypothetical protein ETECTG_CDS0012 [Escherichia phage ETEC-TG]|nr:hypothetical protein ETECTG_CDS0012 [Escherichia phage ETEC-TG]